ncbi:MULTISPECIES: aldehyde dehydrogenase iron-sulfur subunit PaoA [unclassified Sphingobium]|uniref:aldehyde dehydrogenase iron-sulfur subunit PaoA n=1 Tax=unclassified Sphingobium TaxID=2611147 RepID=UPI000D162C5E|nr:MULTISPECIES: aldehyde dehydrogenase iron-sulfur subunit PaoA [unclassified Sphingobium]MBG6118376.1 xanthine dehydrogenase YagT iron-sulfur-binding subunit [Sphingobium sp. JAI105]PSO11647.1 aldehyde dehydrogenase iron-sulfur subunit [Sphingobium sp. AEW4]TWD07956.1 xanthine dehydrogenase YagT iron-sulfur-binding subunit [Sphingobium sp. AEW010]TWD24774.1 xanthine dehydrogenase YagT iron-sulfur-binding subunit [Sphingobium sp. AEW013]TWD26808.1 xanthine dehydrogenase YagT iron-sulfur-bindi
MPSDHLTRRSLLQGSAAVAAAAPTLASAGAATARPTAKGETGMIPVELTVNGREVHLQLDPRTTLLDALREHLHLTGTKKGCDQGQCGACTVIVEGRRINSCLTLAVMHDGDTVTTIEGLGTADKLHLMQRAFITHDGYQCGYCTPGQICSAVAVLEEIAAGVPSHVTDDLDRVALSDRELRERMSGNICRCAAYPNIIAAMNEVAGEKKA